MKKLLPISVIAIFAVAPTFADNITASSTCTNGVLGTYTGPADIEANFDPNTINTTWYSNGTQMTGNGIPGSCTYNAPLTPPTPEDRPGYVFSGWTLKPPPCLIPSSLVSDPGNAAAAKKLSNGGYNTHGGATAATYGLEQPGEWGVSWSNGDKVVGKAKCSAKNGDNHGDAWGGDSSDWTATESELTNESGETQYCWCKVTGYIANGAEQCSLSSPAWVFDRDYSFAVTCASNCAFNCATYVRTKSDFRVALFGGNVAE